VATQTWSVVDPTVLDAGSGVMYRPGQYLKAGSTYLSPPQDNGGDVPSKATAYTLDATAPTPAWQPTTSMAFARTHLNMTLLPDGNVLATGGSQNIGGLTSSKAVFPAELWSPSTGTWSTLASMQTPRMYHSTAVLLPDGRVLVAGGGRLSVATDYLNAEYYSPPYLFRGARPTITSAPQSLRYGASFFVGTPDGADVASVALVRNSAVTHSDNMNQRYLPLSFVRTAGGLTVQAPLDAATAPPGDYMLFIVNTNGVPSVAPFLRFAAPYEDAQPPTAPTGLTAAGAPASATLAWTAATDDVGVAGYAVYRSTVPGFTPTAANQVGTSATTSFRDTGLAAGTYYYLVRAADIAGNLGPASNEASADVTADTVRPVVTLTGPSAGATVGRLVELKANASDDVAVVAVYFLVDGAQVGPEDTTAPYSFTWDSRSVANGDHSVTAVARDAGGNEATAHPITVTVENAGPPGLVAAYSFDEGSGAVAADASGHALNGTIDGATWSAAGKFGGALSFDGDHDLVTVPDADQLDLTTGMTLEAWVRPAALSGYRTIILKEVPGELSYSLYASGDTNSPNAWARIAGHSYGQYGSAPLTLGEWTHVAATYDGAGLVVYVNGTAVASRAITGPLDTSANPLRIGGNAIWGEYFSGLIDEVRIYNTALTEADIRGDMNRRIGITPAGETPPPSVAAVESTSAVSVPTPSTSPLRRRPRPRDLLE
jgi:hypothetical protein